MRNNIEPTKRILGSSIKQNLSQSNFVVETCAFGRAALQWAGSAPHSPLPCVRLTEYTSPF